MGLILSIETATPTCAVALHEEGVLMGYVEEYLDKSHSELLAPMIEQVLTQNQKSVADLRAVAVSAGPGSYTGLRIGASTAKGICFGSQLPLIAVNTLQALTEQVRQSYAQQVDLFCPMLDARRMEVYCMAIDPQGRIVTEAAPKIIDEESFKEELQNQRMLFFGSGAAKCRNVIDHQHASFVEEVQPSARFMGSLAWERFQQNQFEDLAYFEPWYLKEFHTIAPKKKINI